MTPTSAGESNRKDRLCPPPRQRRRSSSAQSAFHRRRPYAASLSRCLGNGRRLLQPLRSTSTTPDRLKPQLYHVRLRLYLIDHGHQVMRYPSRDHTSSSVPGSGPDRHCRTGVVQGDESRWTDATPTRLARAPSVMSSWMDRLERPIHPGAITPLPSPPGTSGTPDRAGCVAEMSRDGLAFAKPVASRPLSRDVRFPGRPLTFPREEERDPDAQGAFHPRLEEQIRGAEPGPVTRQDSWPPRKVDSIHRLFPICGQSPRLISSCVAPHSDGADCGARSRVVEDERQKSRYVWPHP